MAARILDGTKLAGEIRAEVTALAKALALSGVRPGLAVVLVGHNPASEVYVRGKVKRSASTANNTLPPKTRPPKNCSP
jgi:methylenetetrahydrofolate dehydrogenase (NADP+)/methenyltetrahydrofolate cyclohydrolase